MILVKYTEYQTQCMKKSTSPAFPRTCTYSRTGSREGTMIVTEKVLQFGILWDRLGP